jgi:hypothetical protein
MQHLRILWIKGVVGLDRLREPDQRSFGDDGEELALSLNGQSRAAVLGRLLHDLAREVLACEGNAVIIHRREEIGILSWPILRLIRDVFCWSTVAGEMLGKWTDAGGIVKQESRNARR